MDSDTARRKILAFAAKGYEPHIRIVRRAFDRIGERLVHGNGDRVAALRTGEGDRQHAAPSLHPYRLAHAPLPNRMTDRQSPAMRPQIHQSRDLRKP